MNKGVATGVGVVVVVAAAYAGLVYYQGTVFDRELKTIVEKMEKESGLTIDVTETARSFASRSLDVKVSYEDEKNPAGVEDFWRWKGDVNFGLSMKGHFVSDTTSGILKNLTQDGKVPFKDQLNLALNWRGDFKDGDWHIMPTNYVSEDGTAKFEMKEMALRWSAEGKSAFDVPYISLTEGDAAAFEIKNWVMKSEGKSGGATFDSLKLHIANELSLDMGATSTSAKLEKMETQEDGSMLVTGTLSYDFKAFKAGPHLSVDAKGKTTLGPFISFDQLKGDINLENVPTNQALREKQVAAWVDGLEKGALRVTIPELVVSTGDQKSVLKVLLAKEEKPQGLSLAQIDLTFNPASLGNTQAAKELSALIRQSDKKDWKAEGNTLVAHWVLPFEYLTFLKEAQ